MSTITLVDLEGLPGLTSAEVVNSRTAAMRVVRDGKVATASGSFGAINIWRARDGHLHAAFYRNRATMWHTNVSTRRDLERWLKAWWPQLERKS